MPLTARQQRLYRHTANLYKPALPEVKPGTNRMKDVKIDPVPVYSGMPCYIFTKPEASQAATIGRQNQDIIFTYDECHFPEDAFTEGYIDDGWVIELTTSGSRQAGSYWVVQGGPQIRESSPTRPINQVKVLAKKSSRPAGLS